MRADGIDDIDDLDANIKIVSVADARVGEYQLGMFQGQYYWRWSMPGYLDRTEWYGPYSSQLDAEEDAVEEAYDYGDDISFD